MILNSGGWRGIFRFKTCNSRHIQLCCPELLFTLIMLTFKLQVCHKSFEDCGPYKIKGSEKEKIKSLKQKTHYSAFITLLYTYWAREISIQCNPHLYGQAWSGPPIHVQHKNGMQLLMGHDYIFCTKITPGKQPYTDTCNCIICQPRQKASLTGSEWYRKGKVGSKRDWRCVWRGSITDKRRWRLKKDRIASCSCGDGRSSLRAWHGDVCWAVTMSAWALLQTVICPDLEWIA